MRIDIFAFTDYKAYLNGRLDEIDDGGRGSRARLSRAIGCQTAYTAQVLRGQAHFSLEQGDLINDFLAHSEEEADFFFALLLLARAGSARLRTRFQKQIQAAIEFRALLKNRLGIRPVLKEHEQVIYYSSWIYGAIHALASIPRYSTPEKISERLQISKKQSAEVLEFLISTGLLERNSKGAIKIGNGQIHLGSDSPLISKHHINWRFQAVRKIEQNPEAGLHYSSVISISKKDSQVIKEKMMEFISSIKPIIKNSPEEDVCALGMDFFPL